MKGAETKISLSFLLYSILINYKWFIHCPDINNDFWPWTKETEILRTSSALSWLEYSPPPLVMTSRKVWRSESLQINPGIRSQTSLWLIANCKLLWCYSAKCSELVSYVQRSQDNLNRIVSGCCPPCLAGVGENLRHNNHNFSFSTNRDGDSK